MKESVTANNKKIIFLNSYLPRTGHNFTAEVLSIFSDHQVLPYKRSETRLSTLLNSYYSIYENSVFHDSDRRFLDKLFINDLRTKIVDESDSKFIMIKDTSLLGVERLPNLFPKDLHFVLIRDPKNVFLSLIKAMTLGKKSWKNRAKKMGIPSGLYPYYYSRKISRQILQILPDLSSHTIVRYEELVRKDDTLLTVLKEKFGSDKSLDQIKKEIDQIHVINTSFYKEVKGNGIWDMKPKTTNFNPLERRENNFLISKGIELGSKELRKKLNYI